MLEQYAAEKQLQQQAYECCSRRVLLECRWVLLLLLLLLMVLLGARVPVTAWPRRSLVCLSFSLPLSNRVIDIPCTFFAVQEIRLGNLLRLVRSSAARAVRSSTTTTATTSVRVLLESSTARVLLSVAALLLLSARVLVTAWPLDMTTHCIHYVHTWQLFLVSRCDSSLFICLIFVPRIALRVSSSCV